MGQTESGEPDLGYHVLQVAPNSPGEKAGLVPYFDFVVGVNEHSLKKEENRLLEKTLKESVGEEVTLVVWSSRSDAYRKVKVIPSDSWGGAGVAGISIRFCPFYNATAHVWHVLEVHPNSPGSEAGLEAQTDYIVGTTDIIFNNPDDFYTLVKGCIGKSLSLYVYSSKTSRVRLVSITPRHWGGNGYLGCEVGYGYLHQIPSPHKDQPNTNSTYTHAPLQPSALAHEPRTSTFTVHSPPAGIGNKTYECVAELSSSGKLATSEFMEAEKLALPLQNGDINGFK